MKKKDQQIKILCIKIHVLKYTAIETTQNEAWREKNNKKQNKSSQNISKLCDNCRNTNVSVIRLPKREEGVENFCKNNGRKFPTFVENQKPTDPRYLTNSKHKTPEENHTKAVVRRILSWLSRPPPQSLPHSTAYCLHKPQTYEYDGCYFHDSIMPYATADL